jgi:hypothetical protein
MARQITVLKMEALRQALQLISNELDGMNIYTIAGDRYEDRKANKPLQWGVNWSAQGTQDVATTKRFAQNLMTATEICENFNKLEILDRSIPEETQYSLEQFQQQTSLAKKVIELGDEEFITLWLNKEVK